jgi:hypothetical protein
MMSTIELLPVTQFGDSENNLKTRVAQFRSRAKKALHLADDELDECLSEPIIAIHPPNDSFETCYEQ